MADELAHFKTIFIEECYELLNDMGDRLVAMNVDEPDVEDLNAIFRCAHSIKGGAGGFGFNDLAKFTHHMEGFLEKVRNFQVPVTPGLVDALLASADVMRHMTQAAESGETFDTSESDAILEKLKEESGESFAQAAEKKTAEKKAASAKSDPYPAADEIGIYDVSFAPLKDLFFTGNEPLLLLRELSELGDCVPHLRYDELPDVTQIDCSQCYLSWVIELDTVKSENDVREVFEFVEDHCALSVRKTGAYMKPTGAREMPAGEEKIEENAAAPALQHAEKHPHKKAEHKHDERKAAAPSKQPTVASIRVDVAKVDRLVNMIGELVITQSMVVAQSQELPQDAYAKLLSGVNALSQHTIELQESIMAIRMQPVKTVFSRVPRILHDLNRKLGKDIKLVTEGEDTELDKTVIEQLADPLIHMIRNSADHGIEKDVASRVALGKSPGGVIRLAAEHRGGKIVISIEDDGAGVNRPKVLQAAKDKGLISEDAHLADEEIDRLIFMPGFSTADAVSDVSGRGVGMDVVKQNIEGLGGSVTLKSVPNVGMKIEVTLPLTLAILNGMIVRCARELYVIPIANIVETMRVHKEKIHAMVGGRTTVNVRGKFLPLLKLEEALDVPRRGSGAPNEGGCEENGLIVLLESNVTQFGVVVDELVGQQQVVIKSLEENFSAVPGISGATILGDGKVSLILDVGGLAALVHKDDAHERDRAVAAV
ncbi:MAG: chemotaxis protein CheA [Rickettsiales bacterium]